MGNGRTAVRQRRTLPWPGDTFIEKLAYVIRSPFRGKLRRIYLTTFRRGYVEKSIRERKGECLQCGRCCRLLFRCPFLSRDNRCRIYNRKRAMSCVTFPIDARDLADVSGVCGYYFEDDHHKGNGRKHRRDNGLE